jgi:hypothetical protein
MFRLRYSLNKNLFLSNLMVDSKGESFYQVAIHKSPKVILEIRTIENLIYTEFCKNVTDAKRRAKKVLKDFGVVFQTEIRFKKNEKTRKKLYTKTRFK